MQKIMFRYKDRKREFAILLEDYPIEVQRSIINEVIQQVFPNDRKSDGWFQKTLRFIQKKFQRIFSRKAVKVSPKQILERYQTHYVCPNCKNKGTIYVVSDVKEIQCPCCSEKMKLRYANKRGLPYTDSWGNHYIAGDFQREDKWKQAQQEINGVLVRNSGE